MPPPGSRASRPAVTASPTRWDNPSGAASLTPRAGRGGAGQAITQRNRWYFRATPVQFRLARPLPAGPERSRVRALLQPAIFVRQRRAIRGAARGHSPIKAKPVTLPAILALEDGTIFEGVSVGAPGLSVGEVVFNTAMTGYQEILTDPSYARQLVTLTYPHIGNTGCTDQDDEASQVWAAGLIVRDVPRRPSNWRNQQALPEWMRQRGVVAIADIDTRKLTRLLRDRGAMNGALLAASAPGEVLDVDKAIEAARKFPGLKGMDLAKEVTTQAS